MTEKTNKKKLEADLNEYHVVFENFIYLVKSNGLEQISEKKREEEKENIKIIVKEYHESFKDNPKYSKTLTSMVEYLLSDLK